MELLDLYRVKFNRNGNWRYGMVYANAPHTIKAWDEGKVLVQDAIKPTTWEIPIDKIVTIEDVSYHNEYDEYVIDEHERARTHSKSLKGIARGSLFSVQGGVGRAFYVVTKVHKKHVTVEWRGFNGDRWVDPVLEWGGKFKKETINAFFASQKSLQAISGT